MSMLKRLSLLIIAFALLACANKSSYRVPPETFLWEVSKPDNLSPEGQPVSYLLGTIHIGEIGETLKPKVMRAFDASHVLVVETGGQEPTRQESMQLVQSMLYKSPELPYRLGQEAFERLSQEVGIAESILAYYKPWAVFSLIAYAMPENYSAEYGVDSLLISRANEESKPVYNLESMFDGLELFMTLPEEKLTEGIIHYLDHADELKYETAEMVRRYREEKVNEVIRLDYSQFSAQEDDLAFWGDWVYALNEGRNYKWMEKLPAMLENESCFVAVGALHLFGPEGLLAQLNAAGYTVIPVPD